MTMNCPKCNHDDNIRIVMTLMWTEHEIILWLCNICGYERLTVEAMPSGVLVLDV